MKKQNARRFDLNLITKAIGRGAGIFGFGVASILSIATSQAIPSATGSSEVVPVMLDAEMAARSQCFKLVRTGEAPPESWSPYEEFSLTITYDIPATSTLTRSFTANAELVDIATEERMSESRFGIIAEDDEASTEEDLKGTASLWALSETDLSDMVLRVDLRLDDDEIEAAQDAFSNGMPHMRLDLQGHYTLSAFPDVGDDDAYAAFEKNMAETGRELLVLPVVGEELEAYPACKGPTLRAGDVLPVRMDNTRGR